MGRRLACVRMLGNGLSRHMTNFTHDWAAIARPHCNRRAIHRFFFRMLAQEGYATKHAANPECTKRRTRPNAHFRSVFPLCHAAAEPAEAPLARSLGDSLGMTHLVLS